MRLLTHGAGNSYCAKKSRSCMRSALNRCCDLSVCLWQWHAGCILHSSCRHCEEAANGVWKITASKPTAFGPSDHQLLTGLPALLPALLPTAELLPLAKQAVEAAEAAKPSLLSGSVLVLKDGMSEGVSGCQASSQYAPCLCGER